MSRVRVIGVGTPFGDDRAGLEIARQVRAAPPPDCEVVTTDRPGVDLLELLAGEAVILLDAVRSGALPGTIHDLAIDGLPCARGAVSSHGIGIADVLALAAALGRRPRGRFIGIEADPGCRQMDAALSAAVMIALPAAVCRVRDWVDRSARSRV